MRRLKSLKKIETLDSSQLKMVKGGFFNLDSAKKTSFCGIKSTCDGTFEDQEGYSRTDNHNGTTYVYGPWCYYNTNSMGGFN